jgi:hypothetical protein
LNGGCGKNGKHISAKRNRKNEVYEREGKMKAKDELGKIVGKGNASDSKDDHIKYSRDQSLLSNKLS